MVLEVALVRFFDGFGVGGWDAGVVGVGLDLHPYQVDAGISQPDPLLESLLGDILPGAIGSEGDHRLPWVVAAIEDDVAELQPVPGRHRRDLAMLACQSGQMYLEVPVHGDTV